MLIFKYLFMAVTIIVSIFFILNLLKAKDYEEMFSSLEIKEHPLKEIYGASLKLIEKFGFNYKTKRSKLLRQKLDILYGEKYCEFYLRVVYAQSISFTWLILIIGGAISCVADGVNSIVVFAVTMILAFTMFYYYITLASKQLDKKSKIYVAQFPNVVSTMALLVNAGMVLREAWTQVAYSDNKEINIQMQITSEDINNGMGEKEAYYAFATRCASNDIKKFISFLVQGLEKGSKDLAHVLVNQSAELWTVKRESALKQGELASAKLLVPIIIIFVGILIMVMGPIMTNMAT